jgi:Protein of unknown function (DUF998)
MRNVPRRRLQDVGVVISAALALASTTGCVACLVYLHLAPTGYSAVRNAVSEYGVGRYARWYGLQASLAGIAAICLAVALGRPRYVVTLLAVVATARLAIGWFPTDTATSDHPTRRGGIHLILALVAFTTAPWAAIALRSSQHGAPWLGWLMAALALVTMISLRSSLRPWFGLIERGYYAAMLAWLILISVRLL